MKEQFETTLKEIIERAPAKKIKKGTILQMEGDSNNLGFYVKKGLLRSYLLDEKGKEHIFMFAPEEWVIADVEALTENNTVELFIDAIEDSEVISFHPNQLKNFENFSREALKEEVHRLIHRMGVLQRRIVMLLSFSAKERYLHFLKSYPTIVNRVPQKMIASYLGITPEALSAIRGKMAKET